MDMMPSDSSLALKDWLLEALQTAPSGISEYELLTALRDNAHPGFVDISFKDNLTLFRAHLQLFNQLYHLREHLWKTREGYLVISPLKIVLFPYSESQSRELAQHDPMSDYYMETAHLDETTEAELDAMLEKFWSRLLNTDQRTQALEIIGLQDPVSDTEIKLQYRRLVMHHHPDRGGNKEKLQEINAALSMLM